jgi:hypothetical protein
MAVFYKIVNNVLELENNIFSLHSNISNIYSSKKNTKEIYKFLFSNIKNENNLYKFKYISHVMSNSFYDKLINKFIFVNIFYKIQKIYFLLNKFALRCKMKYSKLVVDTDLELNKIDSSDINTILIYHNNSKYLFKVNELLKIIYMALTHTNFLFFNEPLCIKNPYNNTPFGKSILYTLYVHLLHIPIKMLKTEHLDIFFKFKEENFNITNFFNKYEGLLREYSINNHINNSTKKELIISIKEMIYDFNLTKKFSDKININKDFPQDILIKIMKPYLKLNLQSQLLLNYAQKKKTENLLFFKLGLFQKYNPHFGRKMIHLHKTEINGKLKIKPYVVFNLNYKKYNEYDTIYFMNDHLKYKDNANTYEEQNNSNNYFSQYINQYNIIYNNFENSDE